MVSNLLCESQSRARDGQAGGFRWVSEAGFQGTLKFQEVANARDEGL